MRGSLGEGYRVICLGPHLNIVSIGGRAKVSISQRTKDKYKYRCNIYVWSNICWPFRHHIHSLNDYILNSFNQPPVVCLHRTKLYIVSLARCWIMLMFHILRRSINYMSERWFRRFILPIFCMNLAQIV